MRLKINKDSDWNNWWSSPLSAILNSRSLTKQALLKLINKYLIDDDNSIFMDVGCGTGFYSEKIALLTKVKVYSLDFSEIALKECVNRCKGGNTPILFDLLGKSDVPIKQVNLAFSDGLLEHFRREDQLIILSKIKNSLTQGGYVINVVPHFWHPYTFFRKFFFMRGIYEKSMTRHELRQLHLNVFGNVQILGQTFSPIVFDVPFLAKLWPMHLVAISKLSISNQY